MIVKMAIAKENFIDTNETPNFNTNDNFIECLQKIFPFVNIDILEFDGNSFQMISSYNPTNSIFIYTNQQGTFLYTITEATPRVHKNNMIWNCLCYKMEDISNIENVISNNKIAQATIFKNITPDNKYMKEPTSSENKTILPEYSVIEKENYKSQNTTKFNLTNRFWCYKIKFLVNPTTENLLTKEPDGSFNFFFPFYVEEKAKQGSELFPLIEPTNYIQNEIDGSHTQLKIDDIIKKYSTNIKSIELIPFFPNSNNVLGTNITIIDKVKITNISGDGKFTDAGIFTPYGHSINNSFELINSTWGISLKNSLRLGGGVKGIIKLPLGIIQLDTNSFFEKGGNFNAYIKSEGWKIDGLFSADIPPHYINFYTDETSQLYIANMTTNAQELRQINRQYEFDKKMLSENYRLNQVKSAFNNAVDFATGGGLNSLVNFGTETILGYAQYNFDKEKQKANYNLSKEIYEDKIQTQELLSKYTGKTISGNSNATDIISNLSKDNFVIVLNSNYQTFSKLNETSQISFNFIVPQKDYDYSVEYLVDRTQYYSGNQFRPRLNRTNSYSSQFEYGNITDMLKNIFGFDNEIISNYKKISYYDAIGLNYNIIFKLENLPTENPESASSITDELNQTLILKFPIRHKQKWFI